MNKAMELLRRVFTSQQEQEEQGGIEFIIDPIEPSELPEGCRPDLPRLEANCSTPVYNKALSEALTRGSQLEEKIQFQEHQYLPKPEDFKTVWIYNVSKQPYELHGGTICTLKVPACQDGEEYAVATSIPEIYRMPRANVDTNEVQFYAMDGKRVAQDLINPQNLGLDQNETGPYWAAAGGNYNERGVFWSTHNPPLKTELKAAHKRLRKFYQDFLDRANIERSTAVIAKRLSLPIDEVRAAEEYLA